MRQPASLLSACLCGLSVLLLGSCVMVLPSTLPLSGVADGQQQAAAIPVSTTTLSERQKRIQAASLQMLGRTRLVIDGQRFNYDCTGTILAIYYDAGIDLLPYFNNERGNGVTRLYLMAKQRNLLYGAAHPRVGDVIFWDNTYDMNGDGKWDDPLTHAGIVLRVHSDGTIEYVHQNYARGIVVERMNLIHPAQSTRVENGPRVLINSPMRMRSQVYMNPNVYLSGQLFHAFGELYRLP